MILPNLVLAILTLIAPPAYAQAGQPLILESSTTTPQTGQAFTVTITEDVSVPTIGTDVVITYDDAILKFESASPGDVYGQYPNIESAGSEPGTVRISGLPSDITTPAPAQGTFATITFIPQNPGDTTITIDHTPGDTTKSGIIPSEGSVDNLLTDTPTPLTLIVSGKPLSTPTPAAKTGAIDAKKSTQQSSGSSLIIAIIGLGVLITLGVVLLLIKRRKATTPPTNPPTTTPKETPPTPPTPTPPTPQPTAPVAPPITKPSVMTPPPSITTPSTPIAPKNPEDALYGVSVPGAHPLPSTMNKPIAPPVQKPLVATPSPLPLPQNHQNVDQILTKPQVNTPPVGQNPEDSLQATS